MGLFITPGGGRYHGGGKVPGILPTNINHGRPEHEPECQRASAWVAAAVCLHTSANCFGTFAIGFLPPSSGDAQSLARGNRHRRVHTLKESASIRMRCGVSISWVVYQVYVPNRPAVRYRVHIGNPLHCFDMGLLNAFHTIVI